MPSSVVVNYGRKRTDKLGDGSFDGIELGGIFTVEIDEEMDPTVAYESLFGDLKKQVDKDFEALVKQPEVVRAVPAEKPKLESWVQSQVDSETAKIKDRVQALPGEHLSGSGTPEDSEDDQFGTPPASAAVMGQAVMFEGCKVFNVKIERASNGNEYCALRVGKRGPDGIPGQYTTARSFDGPVIAIAKTIREGDFVDVYGYFKPWKNSTDGRFDLELQKIEKVSAPNDAG